MLFAFVACSPESSNSEGDSLLPGEVIPPSESEMVSMTEEEMETIKTLICYYSMPQDYSINTELELTDSNGDTIIITEEVEGKDGKEETEETKYSANGKITDNNVTYTVDDLVVTESSADVYTIENGSILKGEDKLEAKGAFYAIVSLYPDRRNSEIGYKLNQRGEVYKENLVDTKTREVVGSGKETVITEETNGNGMSVHVYDWTVGESRLQAKQTYNYSYSEDSSMSGSAEFNYLALNGKFFDKTSCAKLAEYFFKSE